MLGGTPVVPGVGYGPAYVVPAGPRAAEPQDGPHHIDAEAALAAYDLAAQEVADGYLRRARAASGDAAAVLTASAGLARDPGLRHAVALDIRAGADPVAAVQAGVDRFVAVLADLGGSMAERVSDLRDVERRLVARLLGVPEPGLDLPDGPSVLVVDDLAPAEAAGLDAKRVTALVLRRGGPTSHTAIVARQLAIPCVVGVAGVATVADGTPLLVDGAAGTVQVAPDGRAARARAAADAARRAAVAGWSGPGRTADGHPVEILANVADGASARAAARAPVEGVGLLRTELGFLGRETEPTVAEQAAAYGEVLAAFPGRHVVLRTLDAGSDKPLAYAGPGGEHNPALGVRGLRLSSDDPGLLDRQLDAIAAAAAATGGEAWVMAPMVATVAEAEGFAARVHRRGLKAGIMVEVPSAALLAHRMLQVVDFLSIGTNDLAQYAMAADRSAADLAYLTDPWQPAVLQFVAITADAGLHARKPVGVCGEAAADPLLACVLVGMGVGSLSMAAAAVRPVGARLSTVTSQQCEDAAEAALSADDPQSARAAVRALLG
ncbi:phosphoenolpyruvate--protein phosphotransferase [Nocardioides sp. LMS-CY]|nr:phosphoenolpyruvate--protein phosphotransferase [Nocardioides sp. LMS-CY]